MTRDRFQLQTGEPFEAVVTVRGAPERQAEHPALQAMLGEERAELASALASEACYLEDAAPGEVVLHSDNGAPMKGATMLATLHALGVVASFSRPSVSDDNPFSEALFRTLKYRPEYPDKAFESITAARVWMERFVRWYNGEHCHSALKYVTPEQRHLGRDAELLARRHELYQQARAKHPRR